MIHPMAVCVGDGKASMGEETRRAQLQQVRRVVPRRRRRLICRRPALVRMRARKPCLRRLIPDLRIRTFTTPSLLCLGCFERKPPELLKGEDTVHPPRLQPLPGNGIIGSPQGSGRRHPRPSTRPLATATWGRLREVPPKAPSVAHPDDPRHGEPRACRCGRG